MKIFQILLVGLFLSTGIHGQKAKLIYDCTIDSNDYISNLKVVNGEIYFNSGKFRNPKGVFFCGNGGPRNYKESHVYKLNEDYSASKVFHHNLENDFKREEERLIDSSKIFANSTFFEFSDTSGIFLYDSRGSKYWVKNKNDFIKVDLPASNAVSSYYPKNYGEYLIVRGKDSISDGRLWYFDKNEMLLEKLVPDTFLYKAHNLHCYKNFLIFHGYSKKVDKDNALFMIDKDKKITKITDYDPATVFVKYQTVFREKIIYRVTHRGIKYSHTNTDFTNTELWEYDILSKQSKRVYNFGKYGLTYNAREFGDRLYFLYGLKKYRLYDVIEGDITEKNDVSKTLNYVKPLTDKIFEINNIQYFIGESKDQETRLYQIDVDGEINLKDVNLNSINHLQMIDKNLYFSAVDSENTHRGIYTITSANNDIIKISGLEIPVGEQLSLIIENMAENIYLQVSKNIGGSSNLYQLDMQNLNFISLHTGLKAIRYYPGSEMKVLNNQLFLVSNNAENDSYHQIWIIK